MSGTVLRIIIAAVFLFHGIGHVMGIVPALQLSRFEAKSGTWFESWSSHSWLLTPLLGDTASRILCSLLFALAFLGFVGAALALMGWLAPHELWRMLAVISAIVSLVAIALY